MPPRPRSEDVRQQGREPRPRWTHVADDVPAALAARTRSLVPVGGGRTPAAPGCDPVPDRLGITGLGLERLEVGLDPWFTLLQLVASLATAGPGLSRAERIRLLSGVNHVDFIAAARPFRVGGRWVPRSILPARGHAEVHADDADAHVGSFATWIEAEGAACLDEELTQRGPRRWRERVPRTEPWVRAYTAVALQLWEVARDEWITRLPSLQQEADRFGSAMVRRTFAHELAGVHPQLGVEADAAAHRASVRLDERVASCVGRSLVLAPTSLTSGSLQCSASADEVVVSYSRQLVRGRPSRPTSQESLALVVGGPRAKLLGLAAAAPLTMSEVAHGLGCTRSTATHHVNGLEDAGLVVRRRHGKTVLVLLTPRGIALMSLLKPGA